MRRLRQMQQTTGGRGGGVPPRMPRGSGVAALAGTLMVAGGFVFSNALFNVDGGHRAIKYTRIGGVSKEIYSEGRVTRTSRMRSKLSSASILKPLLTCRLL